MNRSLVPYTGVEYLFGGVPSSVRTAPMYAKLPWFAKNKSTNFLFGNQSAGLAPAIGIGGGVLAGSFTHDLSENTGLSAGVGIGSGALIGGGLLAANMIGRKWKPIIKAQADAYHGNAISELKNIEDAFLHRMKISPDEVNRILSHADSAQSAGLRNFHLTPDQRIGLNLFKDQVFTQSPFKRTRSPEEFERLSTIYNAFMRPLVSTADLTITPRAFSSITKF